MKAVLKSIWFAIQVTTLTILVLGAIATFIGCGAYGLMHD